MKKLRVLLGDSPSLYHPYELRWRDGVTTDEGLGILETTGVSWRPEFSVWSMVHLLDPWFQERDGNPSARSD